MKSKFNIWNIAFIILLFMCGSMNAQSNYGIKIAGTDLTYANAGAINNTNFPGLALTSGTITYDHSTKTFTFNGVRISMTVDQDFMVISNAAAAGEYTINLVDSNSISCRASSNIEIYRNLTITGNGTLSLAAGGPADRNARAISVSTNASLTIKNTTVRAYAESYAIRGSSSNVLRIENSNVRARGRNGSICHFPSILLVGCQITQSLGAAVTTDSYGQSIMLSGSVVTSEVVIEPIVEEPLSYDLFVSGVEVTSRNASNITGTDITGMVSYDNNTRTLTLEGAVLSGIKWSEGDVASVILRKQKDLTINLVGSNRIIRTQNDANLTGINQWDGILKIKGTGSLSMELTSTHHAYGIDVNYGLEIQSGNIKVNNVQTGLRSYYSGITLNGGTVEVTSSGRATESRYNLSIASTQNIYEGNSAPGVKVNQLTFTQNSDGLYESKKYIKVFPRTTDIATPQSERLTIYPNPASDEVNISVDGLTTDATATIYDLHGRVVARQSVSATTGRATLDVSALADGVYMVRVVSRDINRVEQLVVKR